MMRPGNPILPLILAAGLSLSFTTGGWTAEPARPIVAASILPLADFVREVGGRHVRVELLVPPGAEPHTYALRPSQMVMLSKAHLLVLNGKGLEYFASKLRGAVRNPGLRVVVTASGLAPYSNPGGDARLPRGEADPHVWLDPLLAVIQVERIRDALSNLAPSLSDDFMANARRYIGRLRALHREFGDALAALPRRRFIAYHAAYGYLAARYGLEQIAVSVGDATPSPARVAEIVSLARRERIGIIFAEPQFSRQAVNILAMEAGMTVSVLDALGSRPDSTYISLMRSNLHRLRAALDLPTR